MVRLPRAPLAARMACTGAARLPLPLPWLQSLQKAMKIAHKDHLGFSVFLRVADKIEANLGIFIGDSVPTCSARRGQPIFSPSQTQISNDDDESRRGETFIAKNSDSVSWLG
jgi:hypothetical protein